jgi:hypothetical protein
LCEADVPTKTRESFKKLIDDVGRQLVSAEHHTGRSFVRLPLLYPSGANVVVRVEGGENRFFVSDAGFGSQEADMMGASLIYARHGRAIAENAGVKFDNQAFFVIEAERDQLPGAVVAIANCSHEATALAAYKLSERKSADDADALYERLIGIFPKSDVAKNVEIIGSSTTKWPIATLVKVPSTGRQAVFEPVTKHHTAVFSASTKFHDIALLEQPPVRVAVVRRKSEFGPWLGLLSQAASVVDIEVSDVILTKAAEAA